MEVKIIRHQQYAAEDNFSIEIYDAAGKIKGKLGYRSLPHGFIQYDDQKVELRSNTVIYNPVKEISSKKQQPEKQN